MEWIDMKVKKEMCSAAAAAFRHEQAALFILRLFGRRAPCWCIIYEAVASHDKRHSISRFEVNFALLRRLRELIYGHRRTSQNVFWGLCFFKWKLLAPHTHTTTEAWWENNLLLWLARRRTMCCSVMHLIHLRWRNCLFSVPWWKALYRFLSIVMHFSSK